MRIGQDICVSKNINIMVVVRSRFRRKRFTELTNSQWEVIKNLLDDHRKRKYSLRDIVNAILKITRTGCQWRNLDEKYPPWESVYYYFRKWQKADIWSELLCQLVRLERLRQGRQAQPSVCAVDSQSVKVAALVSVDKGIDGHKCINGRKRHIAVDILGLPLAFFVSAANKNDGQMGIELFPQLYQTSKRLQLIRTDNAYKGYFTECANYCGYVVETTKKPESQKGFVPQTGRWQVERAFGWFNFFRRLSKDYEKTVESSVNFMQIAFIDIILARLAN